MCVENLCENRLYAIVVFAVYVCFGRIIGVGALSRIEPIAHNCISSHSRALYSM